MDFLLIVILMVVLYIVPELLKRRRRPERYEYPDIPLPLPPSEMKAAKLEAEPEEIPESKLWTGQGAIIAETAVSARPKTTEEVPMLQGRFTQEALINGFIFAEIIRPPRAYRPMRRRL
ncbi:MAG: hypothetical protein H6Q66_2726 [Firmicutes bacterium]|nr:hypothetical protein [Bacillota bacterium]